MTIRGRYLCLLMAAALAACSRAPPPAAPPADHPALWRIEKDGHHAWLFGTVHALPRGARWESPELQAAMAESERLVVEAVGLDDAKQATADFDEIAQTPGLPPLSARLPAASRADLADALRRIRKSEATLSGYESWAAAVYISATLTNSVADDGVEQLLLKRFTAEKKPIEGLETIKEQFGYLDRMDLAAQDKFLAASIHDPGGDAAEFKAMYEAWRRGDTDALAKQTRDELDASPEVREPLLVARNRNWAAEMDEVIARPGIAFIAVGSGHVVGADSLIEMLKARGFEVTRAE